MAGGGGGGEGEPEFQVAPMVDVLLTILIFFMTITSAQVLKVDKSIVLPVAPNALKKDDSRAEAIINVRWNEAKQTAEYTFDDQPYPHPEDLVPILKQRGANNAKYRAVIRGDRNATADAVARVMNVCGSAGISDISFSTVNKE